MFLRLGALFRQHLAQRLEHGRFARGFLGALEAERFDGKTFETQTAGFVDFKLRQLEAARPEIHRQK